MHHKWLATFVFLSLLGCGPAESKKTADKRAPTAADLGYDQGRGPDAGGIGGDASAPDMALEDSGPTEPSDAGPTPDADAEPCVDLDGDRYGSGPGCIDVDCNDNDASINPGAMEVCGNGIDEDCVDGDMTCPSNCVDNDGDGYGAAGSTGCVDADGTPLDAPDCDDADPSQNPGASEMCDGEDTDCDGSVDECALAGQACSGSGGTCVGGAGSECENQDDCLGQFLTCDTGGSPKTCKVSEGGGCQASADCIDGLACENGVCTGNFCATNPCDGNPTYDVCDRDAGLCVECPHFDPDESVRNAPCSAGQECTDGGWCAFVDEVTDASGLTLDLSTDEELFWMNVWLADCWIFARPQGDKAMCSALVVTPGAMTVTESAAENAYVDGHLDNELTADENDALDDIWGEGLFNQKEINWKSNPVPGTSGETCIWYQPGTILGGEALVVDRCANFVP